MKNYQGNLIKMKTEYDKKVHYYLEIDAERISMNDLIGSELHFKYQNKIHCIRCGTKTKKSYAQGYCYKCFVSAPETSECILRPEKCQAHLGISRDMEWAEKHCLQNHFVYLAISSGLKVGVTRSSQIPTRWMDQGAIYAIKLAKTPNRYLAGVIEVALKKHVADKTNWRKMLKNEIDRNIDLTEEKQRLTGLLSEGNQKYIIDDNSITEINYPVKKYPKKIKSIGFDKITDFKARLTGIKGQYLLFDNDVVLNIRKHNGYLVHMQITD